MRTILAETAGLAALLLACGGGGGGSEGRAPEAPAFSIELMADAPFLVGTSIQLRVTATRIDGSSEELTDGIIFTSSDDSIASVDSAGLVSVHFGGPVKFTAAVGAVKDTLDARATCRYPRFAPDIVYDQTMPPLSWPAKWPDGVDFTLDLADVHCDREWREKIDTLVIVIGSALCGACEAYSRELALRADELETHRTQIVQVIGPNVDFTTADTEWAYDYMDRTITSGRIPGIVVGDLDTWPTSDFVHLSSQMQVFPSTFIVRTRDMKVIASSNLTSDRLDIAKIADNPDGDYSNGNLGSFVNRCRPGDEEDSEPNDVPARAAPMTVGTFPGGICADAPDLYRVEVDGQWELELRFDETVGDLDVLVWDANTNEPLVVDGQVIGSTGSTGIEKILYSGDALVGVRGYDHASAPYTLQVTAK